jgi:hypothetical protein
MLVPMRPRVNPRGNSTSSRLNNFAQVDRKQLVSRLLAKARALHQNKTMEPPEADAGSMTKAGQLSRLPITLEGEARLQAMPQSMAASADQSDRIPSTEPRPALYRQPAVPAP